MMKKGFTSVELSTADEKECGEGYEYMCGCIFHGSYICVGVKPDEYRNVMAPELGLLKYGVA